MTPADTRLTRPADPLPLGFLALAVATALLSGLQLEWIGPRQSHPLALALLSFVVPLQLLACIIGFGRGEVTTATGMGVLAGTWATVGIVTLSAPPRSTSDVLGVVLLVAATAMCIPAAEALRLGTVVPAVVMTGTAVRFVVTAVYQFGAPHGWATAAGIAGLALAALAITAAARQALA